MSASPSHFQQKMQNPLKSLGLGKKIGDFLNNTKFLNRSLSWYLTGWRAGIFWGLVALFLPQLLSLSSNFLDPTYFAPNVLLLDAILCGIYVMLALGLNIVVGYAGLLDLGYVAFFVIGSYTVAFATSGIIRNIHSQVVTIPSISFWAAIPLAALIAGFMGVLLGAPTLRLRGDYLAIVTLGFGEIVPIVIKDVPFFYGALGFQVPPAPVINTPFGQVDFGNPLDFSAFYYLTLAVIILIVMFNILLRNSSIGRAWIAIREDELAASASGVNLVRIKLMAFGLGAAIGGIGGVFNGVMTSSISYDQFSFQVSISVLIMIVLGGIGSIPGVILGAILLRFIDVYVISTISTMLQTNIALANPANPFHFLVSFNLNTTKFLIFGLILLLMIILRPQGIVPNKRRQLELQGVGLAPEELSVVGEIEREESGASAPPDSVEGLGDI